MTTEPIPDTAVVPPPEIANLAFDDALAELQKVVTELEAGGLALERSLELFERGVALQRHCEQLLATAELRVRQLVARAGGALDAVEVRPDEATEER
ncbi:MAG TPA: exodeoxyribonuclease VII small subunit [Candidatus Limnocylindrales bacterium]|jgi:exodeoxyribonuclease VII small subunit